MTEIFLYLLNVSITATWVVLAVMVLRLLLRKAPKWISCLLWGVAGLRLMIPFSLESPLSLIPSAQTVPPNIATTDSPAFHTGITAVDQVVNPVIGEVFSPQPHESTNPLQIVLVILTVVWLAGIFTMLIYSTVVSVKLYRSIRPSVCCWDNIYICDDIDTPFILGIVRPRIFVPSGMDAKQLEVVIAHEQTHLKRKDHWWKPLGYCVLTVYWYNPVLWLAYILLCRDIELACDEAVIKSMDAETKRAFFEALADCKCNRKIIMTCPLSFGEVGVKARIKAVLHYKKPAVWFVGIALIATVAFIVCFLTDPPSCSHDYHVKTVRTATCAAEGEYLYTCKFCNDSYTEPAPLEEHQPGLFTVIKEADCVQEGEQSAQCTVCGAEVIVPMKKTDNHTFENTALRMPTCSDPGEGINTCVRCGHQESCKYALTDHNYSTAKVEKKASCIEKGLKIYTCKGCGATKSETIPQTAHDWIGGNCTTADVCTVCGIGNPQGAEHRYEQTKQSEPTDFKLGIKTYACSVCGKEYEQVYGRAGKYDVQALEEVLTEYAAKQGFCTVFSDNQNRKADYTKKIGALNSEAMGGQTYLEKIGKELIDEANKAFANTDDITLWVIVEFTHGLWESSFNISIYVG